MKFTPLGEPLDIGIVLEFLILPPSDFSLVWHSQHTTNTKFPPLPDTVRDTTPVCFSPTRNGTSQFPPRLVPAFVNHDGISEIMSWPIVNVKVMSFGIDDRSKGAISSSSS